MLDAEGRLSDAHRVLIVADDAVAAEAAEQLAFASATTGIARSGWAAGAASVANQPLLAAIFADAEGLSPDRIIEWLPPLRAAAADADRRLIVAFDRSQLDAVASVLLASDAVLLCEADAAERAVALALTTVDDGLVVHDLSREGQRLQRLNEEVARIAETLARLTRRDAVAGAPSTSDDPFVADRTSGFHPQPAADVDPADIRRAIRARRLRDDLFDMPGIFEDPAWDMLLDLFAAELERRRVSVSSLCIAAAVAPTTALRWIGKLIEAGLLDRRPDEFDRRRAFMTLTARASAAMRNYFAALRRAGLAIV